jgi:hypothetical protein
MGRLFMTLWLVTLGRVFGGEPKPGRFDRGIYSHDADQWEANYQAAIAAWRQRRKYQPNTGY